MSLVLLAPPQAEPISVAEAKLFARIDTTEDDGLLAALITAARLHVEAITRRFLITQSWRLVLDGLAGGVVRIPLAPVQSVMAVRLKNLDGSQSAVDLARLAIDVVAMPARIAGLTGGRSAAGVEVDLVLGYGGVSDVPEQLRHAVRLLVAAWYEERGGAPAGSAVSPAAAALMAPFRLRAV